MGNIIHNCVLNRISDSETQVNYLNCAMNNLAIPGKIEKLVTIYIYSTNRLRFNSSIAIMKQKIYDNVLYVLMVFSLSYRDLALIISHRGKV